MQKSLSCRLDEKVLSEIAVSDSLNLPLINRDPCFCNQYM
jgi:hypothetical protein